MQLNLMRILNVLFPYTSNEENIASLTPLQFKQKLRMHKDGDIYSLASFKDSQVRSAIRLNKFHGNTHAKTLLSALLADYFQTFPVEPYLVIPIPLSAQRQRERGFNQVSTVVQEALRELPHMVLATHILIRTRNTPPQTSLGKKERLKNINKAFQVAHGTESLLLGKKILLIDDVATTGTTLHEAKATLLLQHPLSVSCIAFAH